jgi:hydroxypyruvate isomerase
VSGPRASRRSFVSTMIAAAAAGLVPKRTLHAFADRVVKNGRLKQSVSRWPYAKIPLPDFCRAVADMGLTAIDLLDEPDWAVARQFGLTCAMGYTSVKSIPDGLNNPANHERIIRSFQEIVPRAAAMKVPNLITFFGNRRGMDDETALANCVAGLNQIKAIGVDYGVTICVELLNSKVNHPDYQGDRTAFGVKVVRAVNSPRVKLLYDIYHMQIMEGDLIKTIRDHGEHIAHYHTGGVPGRHELDDTQEVNWRAVCAAIVATGFTGYVAHEFVPTRDPMTSLREAVALCDV